MLRPIYKVTCIKIFFLQLNIAHNLAPFLQAVWFLTTPNACYIKDKLNVVYTANNDIGINDFFG